MESLEKVYFGQRKKLQFLTRIISNV